MKNLIEIFGWYGMVAIVLAYALVSFSFLQSASIDYQLLNITGALGIVVNAFYKKDYQSGTLNVVWIVIALVAMVRIVF